MLVTHILFISKSLIAWRQDMMTPNCNEQALQTLLVFLVLVKTVTMVCPSYLISTLFKH